MKEANNKKKLFIVLSFIYLIILAIFMLIFINLIGKKYGFLFTGISITLFSLIIMLVTEDLFKDLSRSVLETFARFKRLKMSKQYRKDMNDYYHLTYGFSNGWYIIFVILSVILLIVGIKISF